MAKDARFDGLFFVGVTSTKIYCRPICPVRAPKEAHCRFLRSAQAAEVAGFRPCLRCRPELAPGNAPVDNGQRIAYLIAKRIEDGALEERAALKSIAKDFALSSRQVRRIISKELGVAPIQFIQTRRLLLAKQLLTETKLQVTEVAYASGFASLRRFNDAFVSRYQMAPTRLRRRAGEGTEPAGCSGALRLQLSFRPPYDWAGMLAFLRARALPGVEWVTNEFYARTVQLGERQGWFKVTMAPARRSLLLEFAPSLTPILPALLGRVRDLFDLNARPDVIFQHLSQDGVLGARVNLNPGLRVPGAFHGFELGVRAILGQQITVKAGTTLAGRLVSALGGPIQTPFPELHRLTPRAARIAGETPENLATLGILLARGRSLMALARVQVSGELSLEGGHYPDPEIAIARLANLPGIGPWTAHYIAMRALRWPDAFPSGDLALRNNLGGVSTKELDAISQAWRPWRSYAVLQVWNQAKPAVHEETKAEPETLISQ
jgi:AraC family transcriptional regulator of adaptative response / DNA-3-methyladenine glycosylase II